MTRKVMSAIIMLTLALWVANAGTALAGDADTNSEGVLNALDANRGSGVQVNADRWENMDNVLAGDGAQTNGATELDGTPANGNANTGDGSQDNSASSTDRWTNVGNANNGSGAQINGSSNSNGGDRDSNDIVLSLGSDDSSVTSSALEASVSGNAITVAGLDGSADSAMALSGDGGSGFHDLAGVSAVAMAAGGNSSQNVSVSVTADMVSY